MGDLSVEDKLPRVGYEDRDAYWDQYYGQEFDDVLAGKIEKKVYVANKKKERKTLELNAEHDKLTGLFNRGHAEERLESEIVEAGRSGLPLGVLLMDFDKLKIVNDTYGHPTGDKALIEFAKIVQKYAKRCIGGRWGGEEFVAIFPNCGQEELQKFAVEIGVLTRVGVGFASGIPQLQTLSIGAAMWENNESKDNLAGRVDALLYEAKNGGRDRLVIQSGNNKQTLIFSEEQDRIA